MKYSPTQYPRRNTVKQVRKMTWVFEEGMRVSLTRGVRFCRDCYY